VQGRCQLPVTTTKVDNETAFDTRGIEDLFGLSLRRPPAFLRKQEGRLSSCRQKDGDNCQKTGTRYEDSASSFHKHLSFLFESGGGGLKVSTNFG